MVKKPSAVGSQSDDERARGPSLRDADGLGRVGRSSPSPFYAGKQADPCIGPTPRYLPASTALNDDLRAAQGLAIGAAAGLAFWLLGFALWAWLA